MTHTGARVWQWTGIILILCLFGGAYWYFKVYGSTLNAPQNDLNTNGLVGQWSFNGDDISGATAYDRSGSGNNGTLSGSPAVTQGRVGQALSFDGTNDYMSTCLVSTSKTYTFSFWMNRANTYYIFDSNLASGHRLLIGMGLNSPTSGALSFYDGTGKSIGSAIPANEWHHVVLVLNNSNSTATGYVDGVSIGTAAYTGRDLGCDVGQKIGSSYVGDTNFQGKLDEFRIYNRALAAGEIQSLYAQGSGTKVDSAISQPQGTGRLDSGLAGYWAMDDGSGTSATDSSTNASTGTLTNGPTWTTGQIGGAVTFDGTDDYIDTNNGSALDSLSEYTYAAWIYPTSADGFIIAKASNGGGSSGFRLTGSTLQSWRANNVAWSVARSTSSTTVSLNTWSHVAIAYSHVGDKKNHIYLNGVEVAYSEQDTNGSGLDPDPTWNFWIGRKQGANEMVDVPFTGNIDEARIYNRALSADEVAQLSRLTAPTSTDTGLKGYWSFNGKDVSGTSAYDRSGAGNNGTLTNSPSIVTGKLGQALGVVASSSYVTIPDSTSLSPTAAFTLSFWIRPTATVTGSEKTLVLKSETSQRTFHVQSTSAAAVKFNVASSIGDSGSNYGVSPDGVIVQNQWTHVTTVFDGAGSGNSGRAKIYINGVEQPVTYTGTIAATVPNATSPLVFGSLLTATYDEARFYSRALTAGEIKGLYDVGADDKINSAVSQPQGTGRLDSGLAGYWKLDDGSGTSATDSSTNANTGTLTNGPTWTTGQIGNAVTFDGSDDYITAGTGSSLALTSKLSISTWIYLSAIPANGITWRIAYKYSSGDASNLYQFGVGNTGSAAYLYFNPGGGGSDSFGSTALTTGRWYHVAVTFDQPTLKFYIDGRLDKTTSDSVVGGFNSGSGTMKIGGLGTANTNINGNLDETRVYNRALSADEVAQLYRLNVPTGTDTGLKGYWSFNGKDMTSASAYDRSGAGNTGTLSGPTVTPGKLGQALNFDGVNDSITSAANSTALAALTQGSFAFWIKPRGASYQGGIFRSIVNDGGGNGPFTQGFEISGDAWQGTQTVRFAADGSTGDMLARSTTTLSLNTWTHVVVVWDGTLTAANVKFYQNGVLDTTTAQTNGSGSYVASDGSFIIGGTVDNKYLDALLDEVRVYNRQLTAAEVASLYNASK